MTPPAMLAVIGQALYGEHWRSPLARDLGVREDSIRHWMSGRMPLEKGHGVFSGAFRLMIERADKIGGAALMLQEWMGNG